MLLHCSKSNAEKTHMTGRFKLPSSFVVALSATTPPSPSSGATIEDDDPGERTCDCSLVSTLESASSISESGGSDVTGPFSFDGSTSDIAQQLYLRYQAGDEIDQLSLETVPEAVRARLDNTSVTFEDLPGLMQRAVVWDTGFVIAPDNRAVQVWTLGNRSMADISVSAEQFSSAGCVALSCTQTNDETAQIYANCSSGPAELLKASKCVVKSFESDHNSNETLWSAGGDPTVIPDIRVAKNSGVNDCGCEYEVYAIHTLSASDEPGPGDEVELGTNDSVSFADSASSSGDSNFNVGLLVPIIGTVALLIVGGLCCCCVRRQWEKPTPKDRESVSYVNRTVFVSFSPREPLNNGSDAGASRAQLPAPQTWPVDGLLPANVPPIPARDDYDLTSDSGSDYVWKALLDDPNMVSKRLPFQQIRLQLRLSKSASREVRLGEYEGLQVAVKRLLKSRRSLAFEVQEFAYQIQLRAALVHPNLVEFVGVAWNSVTNMLMVMEYLPVGDLATYLRYHVDSVSWENEKFRLAIGVARALVYLHSLSPPVIHGDLRAGNVLLTEEMEAKLIGYGSSRSSVGSDSNGAAGAPFWTAPEVLYGKDYTEKADIYAFGVLLSELDTGKAPYYDAISSIGVRLKPVQILNEVIHGTLRPSFSHECPRRIRVIGVGCCQHDPERRPTAQQLLELLEA
ncbi:hypothetical protein BBJ28_00004523 [Nothophytophthora sp. Chile5]|nr:hypothetical protein BBJ28_00004523 [Nothophytophthora sp. Chile5]